MIYDILRTALYAAVGAGTIAATGFLKSTKEESFDVKKLLKTVLLASVSAAIASLLNLAQDDISNSAVGIFIGQLIDYILKMKRPDSVLRVKLAELIEKRNGE